MREVLYKNLISNNSRKKDVFLQEVFEKDGVIAKTERRCFYFIKSIEHLDKPQDLQTWVAAQTEAGSINKRQFFIFKQHSDQTGEDKLICKILGNFYAVINNVVFTIAFLHSFKVRFTKHALT
ncbi:MAG: hypothetical protein JXB40_01040 [Candidatus Omnitrophica bacterium]|nr:hypothetical protein [Candidatus Omnitrophota bacterium]